MRLHAVNQKERSDGEEKPQVEKVEPSTDEIPKVEAERQNRTTEDLEQLQTRADLRVLVDDERNSLPDGIKPDIIVRNYDAARRLLWAFHDQVEMENLELWIDHDLGEGESGYDLLTWLEGQWQGGRGTFHFLPAAIYCVSANPPGRYRIEQVIASLYG